MKQATSFGKRMRCAALMMGVASLLAGCGSGGVAPFVPAAVPTVLTELTISGTAATGMAIAGANISAKCRVGTGNTTTGVDGSYTLIVPDGQLPCLLELTQADGSRLHTVVTGSGNSAIANVTTLTEMLTARLLRADPAFYFLTFDAALATPAITAPAVANAQFDVRTALTGIVNTNSLDDFIATPLVAATQDNPAGGDLQDRMLDTLGATFNAAAQAQIVAALAVAVNATDVQPMAAALAAPLANAGPAQTVVVGATVTLDASASSAAAGLTLSYTWSLTSLPAGSTAVLTSADTAAPTFTADVAGVYVASLTVNDGNLDSTAITVTVTAGDSPVTPPVTSAVFNDNGDGTVTDPATGLTWMRCSIGQTWNGSACGGTANNYAWDDAMVSPAAEIFAGHSDWRLPNVRELQTILDRTKFNPAIDTAAFPDTPAAQFWSATPDLDIADTAWYVDFGSGEVHSAPSATGTSALLQIRLVRGTPALVDAGRPATDFVDNGDGTVSHTPSGLMWKRCVEGEDWDVATSICIGNANAVAWDTATLLTNSTFAGKNDWRVPTAKEIAELFGYSAAVIASVFPDPFYFGLYWSATVYAGDPSNAWALGIDISNGEAYSLPVTDILKVLLVRTR
ncbi:MAG: DUF1566 domain-containing protein [Burkholderiales bacterium]|nr:DUF1566 domain-containing protein [Burkholderiales bacterium]